MERKLTKKAKKELEVAMKKDFEQHAIDSMTPHRRYPFPMMNTSNFILTLLNPEK